MIEQRLFERRHGLDALYRPAEGSRQAFNREGAKDTGYILIDHKTYGNPAEAASA